MGDSSLESSAAGVDQAFWTKKISYFEAIMCLLWIATEVTSVGDCTHSELKNFTAGNICLYAL